MSSALAKPLSQTFSAFCGLDLALSALKPRSIGGKRAMAALHFYVPGEEEALAAQHARLRLAHDWLSNDKGRVERLWRALAATPSFANAFGAEWGQAEVALCAAFSQAHLAIARELAGTELGAWLSLVPAAELDDGALGKGPGFAMDDARSPELAAIRLQIREEGAALSKAEAAQKAALAARHGLPESLESWLVPRSNAALLAALDNDPELRRLDDSAALVRFARRPGAALLRLREALDASLQRERRCEQALYAKLGASLAAKEELWRAEEAKLVALDLLLASGELWLAQGGVLPEIVRARDEHPATLRITQGRNVPLAARLAKDGAAYTPLDLTLSKPCAVLYGSNMGGKTVVLQTLGFLQGLAQLGLAVPADAFRTTLFAGLAVIAAPEQRLGGLSSFGAEIAQLAAVLPSRKEGWLYLLDEPGRATRVLEGRAVTKAVLAAVAESPSRLLLSTHLDGLEDATVEPFAMRGLVPGALAEHRANAALSLNALMDYRVVAADMQKRSLGEALDVAELLGLEAELITNARRYLTPDVPRR